MCRLGRALTRLRGALQAARPLGERGLHLRAALALPVVGDDGPGVRQQHAVVVADGSVVAQHAEAAAHGLDLGGLLALQAERRVGCGGRGVEALDEPGGLELVAASRRAGRARTAP